ncbi:MAG TPA: substrate-binding domain-containing protein [Acidimicrobiia bacterium]|nr:substrate-binding domain-containing protein [Acidimicrobiia bacterium]
MKSRTVRLVGFIAALSLVLGACGGDGDGEGDGGDSGQIVISGSSTVEPITARVAEAFGGTNPGVAISVDGPGTSDGFVLFCNGETDVSDASRAITEDEMATCQGNGVEPIEIKVAIDGLSVLTSINNEEVSCLAFTDLYALLGIESTGFENWSDANELAGELGAPNAPYPEVPLSVTAPGEESGTFDSFVEIVLEDIAEEREQDPNPRPDYVASPNDNVIIEGISGNDTSLGWVGYAFYVENQGVVKALAVDGGQGCVEPTPESIASNDYPISRPLFIYVDANKLDAKPELVEFVDYYLSDEGLAEVGNAGYVDLTAEEIDEWRANWEARSVGKVD